MADPFRVLLDDRAFIQICGHVVRGRSEGMVTRTRMKNSAVSTSLY
jgi:hypothetical protein